MYVKWLILVVVLVLHLSIMCNPEESVEAKSSPFLMIKVCHSPSSLLSYIIHLRTTTHAPRYTSWCLRYLFGWLSLLSLSLLCRLIELMFLSLLLHIAPELKFLYNSCYCSFCHWLTNSINNCKYSMSMSILYHLCVFCTKIFRLGTWYVNNTVSRHAPIHGTMERQQ